MKENNDEMLLEKIERAFSQLDVVKSDARYTPGSETWEEVLPLFGLKWDELQTSFFQKNIFVLAFLTPEHLIFVLGRLFYLSVRERTSIEALELFLDSWQKDLENYAFDTEAESSFVMEQRLSGIAENLSMEQLRCVKRYLRWRDENFSDAEINKQGSEDFLALLFQAKNHSPDPN